MNLGPYCLSKDLDVVHSVMGPRVDPSGGPFELFLVPASAL